MNTPLNHHHCFLLLGSNQQNPVEQLQIALDKISNKIGTIRMQSSLYSTAAWGKTDQPDFINQVLQVETMLEPSHLLAAILNIELEMGRIRTEKYAPRIIDIDILFYDQISISSSDLTIPHPFIQERRFVLTPMNELAPDFVHPHFQQKISELLLECEDPLPVHKI